MSTTGIRIAITGANGRMGRQLIKAVQQSQVVTLGVALVRNGSIFKGVDAGKMAGIGELNIAISDSLLTIKKDDFDILIDFTRPKATLEYLSFCRQYGKKMVIGTTGFDKAQKVLINEAAKDIGIVFADNFSLGVNLMIKLIEKAAQVIGNSVDIEILEAHHRYKVDAPSGTALAIGKSISRVLGRDLDSSAVYSREGYTGARKLSTIGFTTVRAGDIVGEHTTMFVDIGERLEITHKASSRMAFAKGAIRASVWLATLQYGLFDMTSVLSLDKI